VKEREIVASAANADIFQKYVAIGRVPRILTCPIEKNVDLKLNE
jgi:hypothetical protein